MKGMAVAAPPALDDQFVAAHRDELTRLFSALHPRHEVLGPILQHARSGDLLGAAQAFCDYARSRTLRTGLRPRRWEPDELHLRRARLALDDQFELQAVIGRQPRRADGGLDWGHRGPNNDPEWAWMLNRHGHFHSLILAWHREDDDRYRALVEHQLLDWLDTHPCPRGVSFSATWRPLEAARRILFGWLDLYFPPWADDDVVQSGAGPPVVNAGSVSSQLRHPLGDAASLLAWVSILDHAYVMYRRHSSRSNHLLTEMSCLANIALAWPEFVHAEDWLRYAVRTFSRHLLWQTYPDGAHVEQSNHYQRITTMEAQQFLTVLRAGDRGALAAAVAPRVDAMWRYFAGVVRPDGRGPLNNDGGLDQNARTIREMGLEDASAARRYIATSGRRGTPPEPPDGRFYPWAGQAIMRSRFADRNAQWARFDLGPHGTDHQHRDRLSLELMAEGRLLLADPGRYTYQPGPFRDYFTGPLAHNVLRLDGQGPVDPPFRADTPLPALAEVDGNYQCFAGTAHFPANPMRGQGPVEWTRIVLYVVGQYWLITDCVFAYGARELTAGWHLGPGCTVDFLGQTAVTRDEQAGNLVLMPATGLDFELDLAVGQTFPAPRGWYSRNYNRKDPSPSLEYRLPVARPTVLAWLLMPVSAGNDPVDVAGRMALDARLDAAGVCDVRFCAGASRYGPGNEPDPPKMSFRFDLSGLSRAAAEQSTLAANGDAGCRSGRIPPARSGIWSVETHSD